MLQLALHLIGCRSAWIAKAPRYLQTEFLRRAKADALIYAVSTHAEAGVDLAGQVSSGKVLCLGAGGVGTDLMAVIPAALPPVSTELIPEPESLFQTSGTTGHPKLVWHGHRLFRSFHILAREWRDAGRPWLRHLSTQGFWHVSGQMAAFMALFTGGTLILQDQFNAVEMLTTIERADHEHHRRSARPLCAAGSPTAGAGQPQHPPSGDLRGGAWPPRHA